MTRWILLAAAAVTLAASATALLAATPRLRTSGDEPHYLVTALSLARDRDLDVADEYATRAYVPFHAPDLAPQGRTLGGGRIVEPHDPLLPALLAGPAAAGGWLAAKLVVALAAGAVAALVAGILVHRFAVPAPVSATAAVVLLGTAPFAVYGSQIYPEVPAALAVAGGLWACLGPPTPWRTAAAGAAVVALPWLSVKHVPAAATLAAGLLVRRWRQGRRREVVLAAALLTAAGALYVLAHTRWYGGMTAYAAGRFFAAQGSQLSVLGVEPDVLGRTTRLVGLLVDRHFGLGAWQPAWLLLAPAVAAFVRRRPVGWGLVTAVLGAGWLTATFLAATMHGFWFPGRHAIAALPAGALILGWWVGRSRLRLAALCGAGALGVVSYLALLAQAPAGRTSAVFFANGWDPWRLLWTTVLPDYARAAAADWILHGLWVFALAALVLTKLAAAPARRPSRG